jgi:DNA-binding CsgD family transcriptional regulator
MVPGSRPWQDCAVATPDTLEAGWAALAAGQWEPARDAFRDTREPAALDGLGRALWWLSDVEGAIDAWERAYAEYRQAGDDEAAARMALLVSREYREARGNSAAAVGWMHRAAEILPDAPASTAHGWLRLVEADATPDPAASMALAAEALDIARTSRDPDLELTALGQLGLARITTGDVERGMAAFDEAMAAATGGEAADLRTLGDLYCSLTVAAELTLDMERFEQWNEVVMGFMQRHNHPALLTFCGTCCAEAEAAGGNWQESERWLTETLNALQSSGQRARCVHPATRLASMRVLQGRLEEAERLLEGYEDLPEAVQPLVALYLARGQTALAAARLLRRLNEIGRESLLSVPLLVQLVDVQLVQGDRSAAASTAGSLRGIAERTGGDRVLAEADLAEGLVLGASRDERAIEPLERALGRFTRLNTPFGQARAHLALAKSTAARDPERAVEEARQALMVFERLGATRPADTAAALLRELGAAGRTGPKGLGLLTKRELETLRLVAEGLTNAEIAARLYISTKTAGHHVSNILMKLGLRSRTEAAAYARRYLEDETVPK